MSNQNFRSLRLLPQDTTALDQRKGQNGEVYFDPHNFTLRVYNSKVAGGAQLLRADLQNLEVTTFTGNANTSTKWITPRTITVTGGATGSVSLDGSANVTLNLALNENQIVLGVNTSGHFVQKASTSGNGISGSVDADSGNFVVTSNATDLNTPSTTVFRDLHGNFSAGTITAALTGNVTGNVIGNVTGNVTGNSDTSTKLLHSRTINGTSFDGTSNVVVTADASTLTNTTLNDTVINSSLTSVGTLTNLNVSGDIVTNSNVVVSQGPTQATHATNKGYVDTKAIAMSIAMS